MWYSAKEMKRRDEALKARIHNLPEEDKQTAIAEDLEQGWKEIEDCVLSFKAGRNILEGGYFDTCSLGTWMEIVKAADEQQSGECISYIPIHMVGMVKDIQQVLQEKSMLLNIPKEVEPYAGMVRLDSCGSNEIKAQMSYRGATCNKQIMGADIIDGKWYFTFDDRTFNGVMTYVGQIYPDGSAPQPVWWRPWVQTQKINVERDKWMGRHEYDEWPMEWRVIVQNGRIAAISNYYIQAPINYAEADPVFGGRVLKDYVSSIIIQTNHILNFMKERGITPSHPRYIGGRENKEDVSFVIDFISTPSGPAFLEAGPRVPVDENNIPVMEWGAHPCFFMGKRVSGVAFSNTSVVDLKQFE